MTDVNVEDDRGRDVPVVNPLELPTGNYDRKRLFKMWAGQTGTTFGYVWADHLEDAFEEWVEYLDEHAPGHLVTVGMDELKEAADDLGVEWKNSWPDWGDREFEKVAERAEADLTTIGHTTLKSGATHIPSYEWGLDGIAHGPEFDKVWNACTEVYNEEFDEWPEPPRGVKLPGGKGTKITDLDGVSGKSTQAAQRLPKWMRPPR